MPVLLVEELQALCEQIFTARKFTHEEITACVEEVVDAESRGRHAHGVRMVPRLLEWKLRQESEPQITHDTPVAAHIRGNGALGPLLARQAMDLAVLKAKRTAVGVVGVTNRSAFLTAGHNPRRAASRGVIGLNCSVATSKVAVWGGREPLIGTNPLGIGIPSAAGPIVLDLSTSEMSVAAVRASAARGERLPAGAAIDGDGHTTEDPRQALAGALLAFGAHRGSGLSVMLELLSGPLVGAKAGTAVAGNRGMLFLALDPDVFGLGTQFVADAQTFCRELRESAPRPGCDQVLVPGERGDRLAAHAREHGLDLGADSYAELSALAESNR
jgi:L-2-hydroxycarboxylate dehydrogenase (NAD+)